MSLPENIFQNLIRLQEFNLSINKMTTLPENISKALTKLTNLCLERDELH